MTLLSTGVLDSENLITIVPEVFILDVQIIISPLRTHIRRLQKRPARKRRKLDLMQAGSHAKTAASPYKPDPSPAIVVPAQKKGRPGQGDGLSRKGERGVTYLLIDGVDRLNQTISVVTLGAERFCCVVQQLA